MTAGCIPDKILIKDDTYCAIFVSASPKVVCYTAVFSIVTQRSSPQEHCVTTLKTAVQQTSPKLDCEQSLFFFRFSKGSCTRARAARSPDMPSVTRVAICVSRVLLNGLQKKERLLVVQSEGLLPKLCTHSACPFQALIRRTLFSLSSGGLLLSFNFFFFGGQEWRGGGGFKYNQRKVEI